MYLKQFYTEGLAHCSYLIGGDTECLIVDPSRDVTQYIEAARSYDLTIKGVIETHLHADFVSGHRDLQLMTGAVCYGAEIAGFDFSHVSVKDQESFEVDGLRFQVIETPGHTPEGAVFVVTDLNRGPDPALAFTGDTLMVGDVGRPDLFPDKKEQLADDLYNSLSRLDHLKDGVEVYPAHGMGSLCGRSLSAKLSSTMGTERAYNYALNIRDKDQFVKDLLTGMPEAPDHFARCSEINRLGPAPVSELAKPAEIEPALFAQLIDGGHVVVDTRDHLAFSGGHIPGSYCLSLRGNYATFSGWVLPPKQPLLLVVESPSQLDEAVTGLQSVGLDDVTGYLSGGVLEWTAAGMDAGRVENISIPEFRRRLERGGVRGVDTRLKSEWDEGRIENTIHVPAPDTRDETILDPEEPTAVICSTGNRSILAASLLKQRGFKRVMNVMGGVSAWVEAGYPLVSGETSP